MRAAFFTDQRRFELREVARPGPGPGEVLIDVVAMDLLRQRQQDRAPLIAHHVPLAAIGDGFAAASDKRSGVIRVRVDVAQKL